MVPNQGANWFKIDNENLCERSELLTAIGEKVFAISFVKKIVILKYLHSPSKKKFWTRSRVHYIHYINIQYICWGLLQKTSSKMYVFLTATLHISISKRRVQWTFVIANMTSNKFFATLTTFHSSWQFLQYTLVYRVPLFTNSTLYRSKK